MTARRRAFSRFGKPRNHLHAKRATRQGELSEGKLQSFLPYFLYFTKSRKKLLGRAKSCRWQVFVRRRPPKQGELRTDVSKATMFQGDEAAKDLIGFVRSCCLCELIRGLQNLEAPLGKVLILFVRSRHCGELNRGSQNLETFPKGYGFILFACTKRTKSTPEVCEPLDSGDDSKLCRRRF